MPEIGIAMRDPPGDPSDRRSDLGSGHLAYSRAAIIDTGDDRAISRTSQSSVSSIMPPWSCPRIESGSCSMCPPTEPAKVFKDLKAHLLTHEFRQCKRSPVQARKHRAKSAGRVYAKNWDAVAYSKDTMACGFYARSGSLAERSSNLVGDFNHKPHQVHSGYLHLQPSLHGVALHDVNGSTVVPYDSSTFRPVGVDTAKMIPSRGCRSAYIPDSDDWTGPLRSLAELSHALNAVHFREPLAHNKDRVDWADAHRDIQPDNILVFNGPARSSLFVGPTHFRKASHVIVGVDGKKHAANGRYIAPSMQRAMTRPTRGNLLHAQDSSTWDEKPGLLDSEMVSSSSGPTHQTGPTDTDIVSFLQDRRAAMVRRLVANLENMLDRLYRATDTCDRTSDKGAGASEFSRKRCPERLQREVTKVPDTAVPTNHGTQYWHEINTVLDQLRMMSKSAPQKQSNWLVLLEDSVLPKLKSMDAVAQQFLLMLAPSQSMFEFNKKSWYSSSRANMPRQQSSVWLSHLLEEPG